MGAEAGDAELKRLDFVAKTAEYAYTKANELACASYELTKPYVPAAVDNSIKSVTETIREKGTPIVTAVQDRAEKSLKFADSQLDTAVLTAHGFLTEAADKQRQLHEKNVVFYSKAKDQVLKRIEETTEFLKDKGLTGTAQYALESVKARVADARKIPTALANESNALMHKVAEAWERLTELPAVQKVLDTTKPTIDYAWKQYLTIHDNIVSMPVYAQVFGTSQHLLHRVQQNGLYKVAMDRLYPIAAPIADPALEKITKSPYYHQLVDHLKPQANGANGVAH